MHTNVRSIVVSDAESTSTPPVPPRRKKRKAKPAAIASSPSQVTFSSSSPATTICKKPDRKRLAPPPPPPRIARRIKSRVAEDQSEETVSNNRAILGTVKASYSPSPIETDRNVQSSFPQFEDTESKPTKETRNSENDTSHVKNARGRPFSMLDAFARKEMSKYPPLFFTLHDFQNVMSSTLQQNEEEPRIEPVDDFPPSLNSFRESFENSLEDDENELCFRVTTTNLPFEKCLDRWTATFADHFIEKFDESNRFIFEDYIDRSNKVNVRRSTGPMCYDSYEEEPSVPRLTKVRFVIESPSSSTPDPELDDDGEVTCDSLQNIDPLVDEEVKWQHGSSVRLTEIIDDEECLKSIKNVRDLDQFEDVPLSSDLKTRNDSMDWYSLEDASNIVELEKETFVERKVDCNDSNDSYYSSASQDLQKKTQSEEQSKVAEVSKAWLNLIKLKTKQVSMLAGIEDNCSDKSIGSDGASDDDSNNEGAWLARATSNEICEVEGNYDEIGSDIVEKASTSNDINANINEQLETENENLHAAVKVSITNEIVDLDYKLTINEVENDTKDISISNESKAVIEKEEPVEGIHQQDAWDNQTNKSMQEYRRKIFISESLRNLINRNAFSSNESDDEEEISVHEENSNSNVYSVPLNKTNGSQAATHKNDVKKIQDSSKSQESSTEVKAFERKESISVPVNVRRNSFLENMLSKDLDQDWTSCEIVATHPKPSFTSETKKESSIASRLNDSINNDPDIQKILQQSKAPLNKISTTVPKLTPPKKIVRSSEKNPGEIKCDVLNELLSNFNKIKLKPVNSKKNVVGIPRTTGFIRLDENDRIVEQSLEDDKRSFRNASNSCEITKETENKIGDQKSKIVLLEQTETSSLEAPYSNSYDNKIDQAPVLDSNNELPRKSEDPDTRETLGELSKAIMRKAEAIETGNRVESKRNCTDKKMPVENESTGGTEVTAKPLRSEKTDATAREHEQKDRVHDAGITNRITIARQLELRNRRTDSGDKSAIVRRIPRPHCNINDNNRAETPVAVSDDQSRDTVTITPGRVRSFVRYYEIQRDATTDKHFKANDKDKVDRDKVGHQSVSSICRGLEAKAIEASTFDAKKDTVQTSATQKNSRLIGATETESKCNDKNTRGNSDRQEDVYVGPKDYSEMKMQTDRSGKYSGDSCKQSGKGKRKKSVQFQGGFTVIGAKTPGEDGSMGSLASRDTKAGKKRAPRATLKGATSSGKMDATEELVDPDSRNGIRDAAAQIQAAAECKECSGINRFVPKPETPRLVFYCTV